MVSSLPSLAHSVIASQVGGIPEWLQDKHNGYLIPAGDAAVLAQRMDELSQNPELCQTLGANGLQRLKNEFTPEIFTQRLQAILQKPIIK